MKFSIPIKLVCIIVLFAIAWLSVDLLNYKSESMTFIGYTIITISAVAISAIIYSILKKIKP